MPRRSVASLRAMYSEDCSITSQWELANEKTTCVFRLVDVLNRVGYAWVLCYKAEGAPGRASPPMANMGESSTTCRGHGRIE